MVVALHALIANITVAALRQSNHLAERAESLRVKCFHQGEELHLPIGLNVARTREPNGQEDNQVRREENDDD